MGSKTMLAYFMAAASFTSAGCSRSSLDMFHNKNKVTLDKSFKATLPDVQITNISRYERERSKRSGVSIHYYNTKTCDSLSLTAEDDMSSLMNLEDIKEYRYTRIDSNACVKHVATFQKMELTHLICTLEGDSVLKKYTRIGGFDGVVGKPLREFLSSKRRFNVPSFVP